MSKKNISIYDKKDVYKKKIAPIVNQLKQVCQQERMPMFVAVATANNETGTSFAKEIIHGGTGIQLRDDRISDIILQLNNFQMDHPKRIQLILEELEEYIQSIASGGDPEIEEITDDFIEDAERIVGSEKPQAFSIGQPGTEMENDGT